MLDDYTAARGEAEEGEGVVVENEDEEVEVLHHDFPTCTLMVLHHKQKCTFIFAYSRSTIRIRIVENYKANYGYEAENGFVHASLWTA